MHAMVMIKLGLQTILEGIVRCEILVLAADSNKLDWMVCLDNF